MPPIRKTNRIFIFTGLDISAKLFFYRSFPKNVATHLLLIPQLANRSSTAVGGYGSTSQVIREQPVARVAHPIIPGHPAVGVVVAQFLQGRWIGTGPAEDALQPPLAIRLPPAEVDVIRLQQVAAQGAQLHLPWFAKGKHVVVFRLLHEGVGGGISQRVQRPLRVVSETPSLVVSKFSNSFSHQRYERIDVFQVRIKLNYRHSLIPKFFSPLLMPDSHSLYSNDPMFVSFIIRNLTLFHP